MLELQNGKIDDIVTGKAVAQINVKKYDHIAICKTTVGDDVAETAAAAVKKSSKNVDNTSFLKSINDTIKRLEDSGDMDKYMEEALKSIQYLHTFLIEDVQNLLDLLFS